MCCCGDTYICMRQATVGVPCFGFWCRCRCRAWCIFIFPPTFACPHVLPVYIIFTTRRCVIMIPLRPRHLGMREILLGRGTRGFVFLQPTQFIMVFGRRKFTASSNETDTLQQQPIPLSDAQSLDDVGDVEEDTEQAPKPFSRVPVSAPLSPSSSQQPLSVEHYKFGITERLNDAVALKLTDSATLSFRSPDLIPLMKSFDNMRKKLRQMIATVKTYHQSMVTLDHNRLQVCSCFQIRVQVLCLASHDNI